MRNPPSVAESSRVIPPTTTPASTRIVSCNANVGVTVGNCTVSITATTAASTPAMSTATVLTRFARTPRSRAVCESIAAARMCRPIEVRLRSATSSTQAHGRSDDRDDRDLPDVDAPDRDRAVQLDERRRRLPERPEPEERDRLQQERDREGRDQHHRRRLRPQRPEDDALHREREREHDREAERDADAHRPVPVRRERERERAGHDQLPVREVDEPHHAEDEADPDGHQREDRAEPDRVDLHLQVDRVAEEVAHERYAATMRSVSAASSGVRVRRSSPFASTCVRSASATVRCARCSTSRTPMPRSAIVCSVEKTRSTTVGASPSDGSSRRRIDGRATSARAIASCCCCPPESAPAGRLPELRDDRERARGRRRRRRPSTARARPGREPEPQVLLDRELGEEPAALRDESDPAPRDRLGRAPAQRSLAEADLARARRDEPHDRVQRRRLPRAVRADQPDDLAGRDAQREPADGRDAAVRDLEVAELERAHSRTADSPRYAAATSMFPRISLRRALGQRPALVEHLDPVADVHDQRHVVIDEEHAGVVLVADRAHDLGERRHLGLGQPGGRLVHEHEPRLGRERARDAEPPLVAVRQRARGELGVRDELQRLEQRVRATPCLARSGTDAERGDLDVLAHREPAERAAVLERAREAGAPASVRSPARDVAPFELDRPLVREVEPGEDVHERRLAGAVRADQPDHLVAVELERDVAERLHPGEGTRDAGGPERGSGPPCLLRFVRPTPA